MAEFITGQVYKLKYGFWIRPGELKSQILSWSQLGVQVLDCQVLSIFGSDWMSQIAPIGHQDLLGKSFKLITPKICNTMDFLAN